MTETVDGPITIAMELPHSELLFEHIKQNARRARKMFASTKNSHAGKRVAICGAGPSLQEYLDQPPTPQPDQVWACNSAVPFLKTHGGRVTHAFGIDQGLGMLEDWKTV